MATAAEIITMVRDKCELDLTEMLSDTMALYYVNEAYADVWNHTDFPFTVVETTLTVLAGQSSVAVPGDFNYMVAVRDSNDIEYNAIEMSDAFNKYPYYPEYKISSGYFKIKTAVPSDTVFTVFYSKNFVPLASGDTPLFPSAYHYALAYLASAKILKKQGDTTDNGKRKNDYQLDGATMINKMLKQAKGPVVKPFVIGQDVSKSVRLRRR